MAQIDILASAHDLGAEKKYTKKEARYSNNRTAHDNNFSFLRLVLCLLVILSHSFEAIDGNREREILTRIFRTISFGDLAVNGFFLLSGFLVAKSWLREPRVLVFVKKRVLRLYPGFIIASLLSAFVFAPFGAASVSSYFTEFNSLTYFATLPVMKAPIIPAVFVGTPYAVINASMWSLPFELRCYFALALLGAMGLANRKWMWLLLFVAIVAASLLPYEKVSGIFPKMHFILGEPVLFIRTFEFFCAGVVFYFFYDKIPRNKLFIIAAMLGLTAAMFFDATVQVGLATLGGYLLLSFAFARIPALDYFKRIPDISYGLYLYGYPIQKLLLWYIPGFSPLLLFVVASTLAAVCGVASWFLIEKPFLRLKSR